MHLISFKKKGGSKCFCDLFGIKDRIFYSYIFPLPYIVISEIGIRFYNQFNFSTGNLPPKFDSFLSVNDSIHSYNTRHASFFWLPLCRTNIRQFSISFQGRKFFNTLSYEIKNTPTLMSFKLKLKDFNQQL